MSTRFAEREHRRAKGAPPADDVTSQIDEIEIRVREMRRMARLLSKELSTTIHEIDALRRDVAATKKGKR